VAESSAFGGLERNAPASGAGYVTRFHVTRAFTDRYDVQQVMGREIVEYWIPAQHLDEHSGYIVGTIEVVAQFHRATDFTTG
jgi:hypothetical protein